MKRLVFRFCLGAYLVQAFAMPALAQGDPVITPSAPAPKIEIQEPVNNNNSQAFFQLYQSIQNQQNSLFNTPAVQLNPAITPLDQRSGLIKNSTDYNPFGVSGLGITSVGVPKINNSNLLANPDNNALARDVANYLLATEPRINVQTMVLPKLNSLSTTSLLTALAMALGISQDTLQTFLLKNSPGSIENLRSNLISMAINLKIGNLPVSVAKNAFMQMIGLNPAMVASSTQAISTTQTTQTSSNISSKPSFDSLSTLLNNLQNAQTNIQNAQTTQTKTVTTQPIQTNTQTVQNPTNAISSLNSFVGQTAQNTQVSVVNLANQLNNTQQAAVNTGSSTSNTSNTDKKDVLDSKIGQLQNAQTQVIEANKVVGTTNATPGANVQTVGAVLNNPTAFTNVIAKAINGTVAGSINSIANALGLPPSNASAKAPATPTYPPGVPNPVALVNGAVIQASLATLKVNPIVGQAISIKAALGHFNSNPATLQALAKLISTPGIPPEFAQVVAVKTLENNARPGDIPVRAILAATPSTNTSSNPAVNALIKQLDGMIDDALVRLGNSAESFIKLFDALNDAIQQNNQNLQQVKFKG